MLKQWPGVVLGVDSVMKLQTDDVADQAAKIPLTSSTSWDTSGHINFDQAMPARGNWRPDRRDDQNGGSATSALWVRSREELLVAGLRRGLCRRPAVATRGGRDQPLRGQRQAAGSHRPRAPPSQAAEAHRLVDEKRRLARSNTGSGVVVFMYFVRHIAGRAAARPRRRKGHVDGAVAPRRHRTAAVVRLPKVSGIGAGKPDAADGQRHVPRVVQRHTLCAARGVQVLAGKRKTALRQTRRGGVARAAHRHRLLTARRVVAVVGDGQRGGARPRCSRRELDADRATAARRHLNCRTCWSGQSLPDCSR